MKNENTKNKNMKNLVNAALCLDLCMVLPFLTGQIPQIGSALSPMHIPVLLCGFICGWPYGLAVGFLAPLLRFMLFGMPPIFPTGIAMAFELASYGVATGLLYKKLPKTIPNIYISLIVSMLARCLGNCYEHYRRGEPGAIFAPAIPCRGIPQCCARHHLPFDTDTCYCCFFTESALYRI